MLNVIVSALCGGFCLGYSRCNKNLNQKQISFIQLPQTIYTMLMKLHDYIEGRTIIGYVWQFLNRRVDRFMERIVRLYEQEPPDRREGRLGQYI